MPRGWRRRTSRGPGLCGGRRRGLRGMLGRPLRGCPGARGRYEAASHRRGRGGPRGGGRCSCARGSGSGSGKGGCVGTLRAGGLGIHRGVGVPPRSRVRPGTLGRGSSRGAAARWVSLRCHPSQGCGRLLPGWGCCGCSQGRRGQSEGLEACGHRGSGRGCSLRAPLQVAPGGLGKVEEGRRGARGGSGTALGASG